MSMRCLLCMAAVALWSGPLMAANPYQQAMAALERHALDFMQARDHTPVDVHTLTANLNASPAVQNGLQRGQPAPIGSPDAHLDALTRSIRILEAREVSLPHVRYRVIHSTETSVDVPEARQDYVEVTRYNLGPALRDELLRSVPDGQVADAARFGVGPHVSWRFVMAPVMGVQAGLMHAGRKEISAAEAQTADCLGESCLSLIDPSGPALAWHPLPPPRLTPADDADKSASGVTRPARVVQELWASVASEAGMDALPYTRGKPQFVLVVSQDVAGQDAVAFGLLRQAVVMDDAVKEIWTQRGEVAQMPAAFSRLSIPRR